VKLSKPLCIAVVAFGMFLGRNAAATEVGNQRIFGLGFALGDPNSLVGKVFVGAGQAIDFGIGFRGYGYGYGRSCWDGKRYVSCRDGRGYNQTGFHADYLWQENLINAKVTLDWHIGVGARVWHFDDGRYVADGDGTIGLAARMPVGLDLSFQRPDFLEAYLEVAPSIYVLPGGYFDMEVALGVRFYF